MMDQGTQRAVEAGFSQAVRSAHMLGQDIGNAPPPAPCLTAAVPLGVCVKRFAEGETIFSPGVAASSCYRIISGRVEIRPGTKSSADAAEHIICEPGEIFGEVAALSGGVRYSQAVAMTSVICTVYTPTAFVRGIECDRDEVMSYVETILNRQRRASRKLLARIVEETWPNDRGVPTATSLQSSLELYHAVEQLLDGLQQDEQTAIDFARRLTHEFCRKPSRITARLRSVA